MRPHVVSAAAETTPGAHEHARRARMPASRRRHASRRARLQLPRIQGLGPGRSPDHASRVGRWPPASSTSSTSPTGHRRRSTASEPSKPPKGRRSHRAGSSTGSSSRRRQLHRRRVPDQLRGMARAEAVARSRPVDNDVRLGLAPRLRTLDNPRRDARGRAVDLRRLPLRERRTRRRLGRIHR